MLSALMADIERDLCKKPNILEFFKYMFFKRSFQAVLLYRIRHRLNSYFLLSKINIFLDWFSFFLTSCDISSKAVIGQGFYLPHAVGVVIGSGCVIEEQVTVYQNVTLGRRDIKISEYPTIGCNSVLSCGSAVLGPVKLGKNCIVAANSVVLKDIQNNSVVAGIPGKVVKCS